MSSFNPHSVASHFKNPTQTRKLYAGSGCTQVTTFKKTKQNKKVFSAGSKKTAKKRVGRPPSKLSEIQVRMIRIWWEDNPEISLECMACYFNISETYLRSIIDGRRWKTDRDGNELAITKAHPARFHKGRKGRETL